MNFSKTDPGIVKISRFLWNSVSGFLLVNLIFCETFLVILLNLRIFSSVIRQKGESQNGYFKKTKHAKFSEKWTFLFSENLACLFFLATPVLGFALLTYYRHFVVHVKRKCLVHGCNFFKELQRVVNKSVFQSQQ